MMSGDAAVRSAGGQDMPGEATASRLRVLILGGTAEAAALAEALTHDPGFVPISSLAGRTRAPAPLSGVVRTGGFGGAEGLAAYLRDETIDRVVDATHPFAAQISAHAEQACRATGVPRLRLLRPPWRPQAGDRWIEVEGAAEAAARLPVLGRRAFLTVGQKDLGAFADVPGVWLLVRTIEPVTGRPLASADWLQARGPFGLESELRLLRHHRIDVLVTKASGGQATRAKLDAARTLGLPVIMIRRPPPPPGPIADDVAAALRWLQGFQGRRPIVSTADARRRA